jgi:hypothetical protein
MNPEIKQKWIDALRSGEYKQTWTRLRCENSYCCLGVLTNLYLKETNQEWDYNVYDKTYGYESFKGHLPDSVVEWSELESNNPRINNAVLSYYNDVVAYSFNQIADLIEEHL